MTLPERNKQPKAAAAASATVHPSRMPPEAAAVDGQLGGTAQSAASAAEAVIEELEAASEAAEGEAVGVYGQENTIPAPPPPPSAASTAASFGWGAWVASCIIGYLAFPLVAWLAVAFGNLTPAQAVGVAIMGSCPPGESASCHVMWGLVGS